jgi:hypothetical protein
MFNFTIKLLAAIFSTVCKKRKDLIFTMLLLKKENEILKRSVDGKNKKLKITGKDRFSLPMIAGLSKRALNHLTIVKPKTVLEWQRKFIKNRWTYPKKKPGRKPVSKSINVNFPEFVHSNLSEAFRVPLYAENTDIQVQYAVHLEWTFVNSISRLHPK